MTWTENLPSVILVTQQFNPSVLSQMWLSRVGVLDSEGTLKPNGNSIFSGDFVQAVAEDFVLVATSEHVQFAPNVEPADQQRLTEDRLGTLIQALPHVPYRAVGLNFNWHLTPELGEAPRIARALFGGRSDGVYARFSDGNPTFGAYLSKDFGPFRMKVDIKPVTVMAEGKPGDNLIQFAFNFHADLPHGEEAAAAAVGMLSHWDAARHEVALTLEATGHKQ